MGGPTKSQLMEAVLRTVPYPSQICDIDFASDEDAIRFTWRGNRFRVTEGLCETSENGFLHGSDIAILLESLVKIGLIDIYTRESKTA